MSMIPRPVSGALQVYLAQNGNLYAVNQVDGRAYQLTGQSTDPSGGVPEAPTDGQQYGRQTANWTPVAAGGGGGNAVQKTGDTMTGALVITNVNKNLLWLKSTVTGQILFRMEDAGGNSYAAIGPVQISLNDQGGNSSQLTSTKLSFGGPLPYFNITIDGANGEMITDNSSADGIQLRPNSLQLTSGAAAMTAIPAVLYQDTTGNLWVTVGQSDAPVQIQITDLAKGSLAGSGGGGVQKTGDVMTGTLAFEGDQFDSSIGAATPAITIKSANGGPSGFQMGQFGGIEMTGSRRHLIIPSPGGGIDLFTADGSRLTLGTDYSQFGIGWFPATGYGVNLGTDSSKGDLTLTASIVGNGISLINGADGHTIRIYMDPSGSGDLLVTHVNAAKTINLTNGYAAVAAANGGSSTNLVSPDGNSKVTLFLNNDGDLIASQTAGPNTGKSANLTYGKWT